MKDLIKKLLNENDSPKYTSADNVEHAGEMYKHTNDHLRDSIKTHLQSLGKSHLDVGHVLDGYKMSLASQCHEHLIQHPDFWEHCEDHGMRVDDALAGDHEEGYISGTLIRRIGYLEYPKERYHGEIDPAEHFVHRNPRI